MNRSLHKKVERKQQNVIQNISLNEFKTLGIVPQVALITANDVERDAVLNHLEKVTTAIYKISIKSQTYYIGKFGQFFIVMVRLGTMGADGPTGATATVIELINIWNVDAVIAVGIAMGMNPNEQKFGDVLISQKIQNYDKIKRASKGKIERGDKPNASTILFDRFVNCTEWEYKKEDGSVCKKHSGLLITGDSLVNQKSFAQELKKRFPEAIGNEMEAIGIWTACETTLPKKEWIIIKGICDFGIDKTDDYQQLAAASAVSLCKKVLSNPEALNGIAKSNKAKKANAKNTPTIKINSLKLYYYRKNEKQLTTFQLSEKTEIPERRIIELESFHTRQPFGQFSFPDCTKNELKKLERELCDGRRILETKNKSTDFMGYFLSYYYKHKLAKKEGFNNFKAIVFDFDGTLTDNPQIKARSTWQKIWTKLGYTLNDCNELHQKFSNNEISHKEWCNITCQKFKQKNMNKNILKEIAGEMILIQGCFHTLRKLKNNGIHLYISSGSIKDVIDDVIGKENIEIFDEIKSNKMLFDKNGKLSKIIGTKFDFKGKADFIEEIAKKLNINPYEILFIGNSNNDDFAYQSGAVTLCVNPHLTKAFENKPWNNVIYDMQNLDEILQFINL